MKLCTFELNTALGFSERIGVLTRTGKILDLNFAYSYTLAVRDGNHLSKEISDVLVPPNMVAWLRNENLGRQAADEALDYLDEHLNKSDLRGLKGEKLLHNIEDVRLLAPIIRPASIRDGSLYLQHWESYLKDKPEILKLYHEMPGWYYKGNPSAVQGTDTDIIWPAYTERLDYELEIAAIIGRQGVDISPNEAWEYIAGFTIFNDITARDVQPREFLAGLGMCKSKDMDSGNILGPFLVTSDEWDPRDDHQMVVKINGVEWSRNLSSTLTKDIAGFISYISMNETIYPGDVIGLGTVGRGCGEELGKWPNPGDIIELEIEGIGILRNRFAKN